MAATWTLSAANPGIILNAFSALTQIISSGINGGVSYSSGKTFVMVLGQDQTNRLDPTSITIGGVGLTKAVGDNSSAGALAEIWYADLNASASDTLIVNVPAFSWNTLGIESGYLTGAATGGPANSGQTIFAGSNDPQSLTQVVPANGIGVPWLWCLGPIGAGAGTTPVWTNAVGDEFKFSTTVAEIAIGHTVATGSLTVTVSGSGAAPFSFGFQSGFVMASWGPSGAAPPVTAPSGSNMLTMGVG